MSQQVTLQTSLLEDFGARLARVETFLGLSTASDGEAPQIQAYDDYVDEFLPPFLAACATLGDPVRKLVHPMDFESLAEVQSCLEEADTLRDNRSEFANHQNMVHEASKRWAGNKIRVQYNHDHITFVTTLKGLLTQLAPYIKVYHLVGVTWNAKGGDAVNFSPADTAPVVYAIDQSGGTPEGTKDMKAFLGCPCQGRQTRRLRGAQRQLADRASDRPQAAHRQRHHHEQQVYVFGCEGATILLEGKAKNIVLDSCKKTKLIFDNAVSSIEIVNCRGVQVQCEGVVPSVAIDKTDGCLVYVSWEGREVQFVTSKSSEMNVAFPEGAGSDDYVEKPIPEQFGHKITGHRTISPDVSDLYSH
ncbi:F-actin-capping protein subunit alpha [Phytophthora pseudosyringae]|uniref:F-actin-capping protein subunit alpha n=1 Tax=Phytophthora pseudosyringae TaxID=221518 RepID=A0A8T1WL40_9STRA|nr:F-actin-capping protein subunit alpha [Phytophthora pseudosyringae]